MAKAVDYINVAIVGDFERGYYVSKDDAVKAVAIERAEMIDKVCKWLEQNVDKYLYNTGGYEEYIPKCGDKLFYDFKKAMQNG